MVRNVMGLGGWGGWEYVIDLVTYVDFILSCSIDVHLLGTFVTGGEIMEIMHNNQ